MEMILALDRLQLYILREAVSIEVCLRSVRKGQDGLRLRGGGPLTTIPDYTQSEIVESLQE